MQNTARNTSIMFFLISVLCWFSTDSSFYKIYSQIAAQLFDRIIKILYNIVKQGLSISSKKYFTFSMFNIYQPQSIKLSCKVPPAFSKNIVFLFFEGTNTRKIIRSPRKGVLHWHELEKSKNTSIHKMFTRLSLTYSFHSSSLIIRVSKKTKFWHSRMFHVFHV